MTTETRKTRTGISRHEGAIADFLLFDDAMLEAREFWRARLAGLESNATLLPPDPDALVSAPARVEAPVVIDPALAGRLLALTQGGPFLMATVFFSVGAVLRYAYTGATDVVLGSPTRRAAGSTEGRAGVPVRVGVEPAQGFKRLLMTTRQALLDAYAHQQFPLERIVEDLGRTGALFDVAVHFAPIHAPPPPAALVFSFVRRGDAFVGALEHDGSRYNAATIERVARHYALALARCLRDPAAPLAELSLMEAGELEKTTRVWNETAAPAPAPARLDLALLQQAARTPDALAVATRIADPSERITYAEMIARASRLAWRLRMLGAGAEDRVAVLAPRSVHAIVAVVGVLLAGCAFVPLDPATPEARLEFILGDAAPAAIVTVTASRAQVPASAMSPVIVLDDDPELRALSPEPPASITRPEQLAYVLYTSGSTGRPKGCQVEHRNVTHYLDWASRYYLGTCDVGDFGLFSSLAFDLTVTSLFLPLLRGRAVHVYAEGIHLADVLRDCMAPHSPIDALKLTPSHLRVAQTMALERVHLALVILGGEAVPEGLVSLLHELNPAIEVYNEYGPTEATVGCVAKCLRPGEPRVLIGRPIANMRAFVVGPGGHPSPVGVPGELLLAGAGVTRGYLNLDELTARVYVADVQLGEPALYRTGDYARWTDAGELEFLGRRDDQVKLRGHRVELGEIAAALRSHPEVEQAEVVVRPVGDEDALVMYLVAGPRLRREELDAWLRARLPEPMVPTISVALERMPVNDRGKVDRAALPAPRIVGAGAAPRDAIEAALLEIWRDVLEVDQLGVHDDFFALGGQSLKATQVMSRIHRDFALELPWGSIFAHPTVAGLAAALRESIAESRAVVYAPIEPAPAAASDPLSLSQRRLWILHQLGGDGGAYNIADAIMLKGPLEPRHMEETIARLIARHATLRTSFVERDGEPWQIVHDEVAFSLPVEDVEDVEAERLIAETTAPFDLSRAPLVRARLLRLAPERHVLVLTVHHIACDGWSLQILARETMEIYAALVGGREPELAPLRLQYRDYVAWQRARLSGPTAADHRSYWLDMLRGRAPVELPSDRPRPPVRTVAGQSHRRELPRVAIEALARLVQPRGASLFMACASLVAALIHRYVGQREICLGFPVLGRQHVDLEPLVGYYASSLPVVLEVDAERSFLELVDAHARVITETQAHQDVSFERLIGELGESAQAGRNPLFDIGLQIDEGLPQTTLPGLELEPVAIPGRTSKFDVLVNFRKADDGAWSLGVEYSVDLFDADRIERLAEHLEVLLASVVEAPERPLSRLALLPERERSSLLSGFNPPPRDYPRDRTIVDVFAEVAARAPDAIATRCGTRSLRYRVLDERSALLAACLVHEHDVRPGATIGVLTSRTEYTPLLLLAILRLGATYLPLDGAWPDTRIELITRDSGCRLVLADPEHLGRPCLERVRVLDVTAWTDGLDGRRARPLLSLPPSGVGGDGLAYIAYTSGSTGQPKGALITHRAVLRLVLSTNYIELTPDDRVLSTGSLAFDASTFEIWGALLSGASVHFAASETLLDPAAMRALLVNARITVVFLTTALFNQLAEADPGMFAGVRVLLTGGERVSVAHINRVRERNPALDLLHVYGPTENTTFTTFYRVRETHERDVPIGAPIANTTVYIVDPQDQLAPIGVPGELLLGGDGLARGYLNRPELGAARFIRNPFGPGLLYRTGDIGRWRSDGNIEFIGRVDDQVKIRGFRVEPGEVEVAARRHPDVAECVVVARRTEATTLELVGYYVARASLGPGALRRHLEVQLPAYMIPSFLVALPGLPLNSSSKIDRAALPSPESAVASSRAAGDTEDPQLAIVLELVEDLLLGQHVTPDDNLFEFGFDSIKAIQLINRLAKRDLRLEAAAIYADPTPRQITARLSAVAPSRERRSPRGPVELTPVQRWFFETHAGHGPLDHFNQAVVLRVQDAAERIDIKLLREVLMALVERHEALRMRFDIAGDGAVEQRCARRGRPAVELVELDGARDPGAALTEHAAGVQASLDLRRGVTMGVVVYRMPGGDRLLWVIHHLVVDGVSWRILLEELERAYTQRRAGEPIDLGPAPASLTDWTRALAAHSESGELRDELPYWQAVARTPVDPLPLASTPERAAEPGSWGTSEIVHTRVSHDVTATLTRSRLSTQACLLEALARALDSEGSARTLVTLEGHGREPVSGAPDLTQTIGWFTSLYPFVLERSESSDPVARVEALERALARIPSRGIGYSLLTCGPARDRVGGASLACTPALSFNYLGELDALDGAGERRCFVPADEHGGPSIAAHLPRAHAVDLVALVTGGRLSLTLRFDPAHHQRSGVQRLAEGIAEELACIARRLTRERAAPAKPTAAVDERLRSIVIANRWEDDAAHRIVALLELTPLQHGLMFQAAFAPTSRAYHIQNAYEFTGAFDPELFLGAWSVLHERHCSLRCSFVMSPEPYQVAWRVREPEVLCEDLRDLDDIQQQLRSRAHREQDLGRGFDLARDPLMRIAIFRLGEDRYHVHWSFHHIILDGWSAGVLLDELGAVYDALASGGRVTLASAPDFTDYVNWLRGTDTRRARAYWERYLAGFERPTTIVTTGDHDARDDERELEIVLSEPTSRGLEALAREHNVTLFTVILALWAVILARYNRCADVVLGTVVSGRPSALEGAERMVGLLINTVPVRVRFDDVHSLGDLLRSLLADALASEPHSFLPLPEVFAQTPLGSELFDHLLIFENYPRGWSASDNERAFAVKPLEWRDRTHYGLCVVVTPGDEIHVRLSYDARLADESIRRLAEHVRTAAASAIEGALARGIRGRNPSPLDLEILPAAEREALARWGSAESLPRGDASTVLDLFAASVARVPDTIAARDVDTTLTYRELDARARTLAHHLIYEQGVGAGDFVVVFARRSVRTLVAVLGALMSGAAYLPIEPGDPPARVAAILSEHPRATILVDADSARMLPDGRARAVDLARVPTASSLRPLRAARPEHAAYVIYTSGSTGRPKGCVIEHANLMSYVAWAREMYCPGGRRGSFGLFTSLSYDLTVTSLFVPLTWGQRVHVFSETAPIESVLPALFDGSVESSTVKMTPAHVELIAALELPPTAVETVIVGGDALRQHHVDALVRLNPDIKIYNEYGPTEATVGCVVDLHESRGGVIPIGRPISGARVYLLDAVMRRVPIGISGELYIGGAGVARGYLGRDELTRARFLEDPRRPGERVYKTGDLARVLPDGKLEYLGREDRQVKLRGHRIELAEIEAVLAGLSGVAAVAVAVIESPTRGPELAAYFSVDSVHNGPRPDAATLRRRLREFLPEPMMPSYFVELERLPLSPSGKLDASRLPAPGEPTRLRADRYRPPSTVLEARLAAIWGRALGVSRVGLDDNFFELGGHSLKAIQIMVAIHRELGVKLAVSELFTHPTVEAFAPLVTRGEVAVFDAIAPAVDKPLYELSAAQSRLWLLHQLRGERAYNMPESIDLQGALDRHVVARAFATLVERHEALRTAFVVHEGTPMQKILPALELPVRYVDLSHLADAEARARLIAHDDSVTPFELARPPLLRVTLIKLAAARHLFLINIHHIIGDGWSSNVLGREFHAIYEAYRRGLPNPLRPLRIQYKDFSEWQNTRGFAREERYWLSRLAGVDGILNLPVDRQPGLSERSFRGAVERRTLSPEVVAGLRRCAAVHGATLSTVLLSVIQLLLHQLTGHADICVGIGTANRDHAELEAMIGFFVNILVIRTTFHEEMTIEELVGQVNHSVHEAFEHQSYPFDRLVRLLKPERTSNWQPLINVVYAFQNFNDVRVELDRIHADVPALEDDDASVLSRARPFQLEFETSKFDLVFFAVETRDGVGLTIEYDIDLFVAETIATYLEAIERFSMTVASASGESG